MELGDRLSIPETIAPANLVVPAGGRGCGGIWGKAFTNSHPFTSIRDIVACLGHPKPPTLGSSDSLVADTDEEGSGNRTRYFNPEGKLVQRD